MDGFFEGPGGMRDADYEMAALEDFGNVRYRRFTRRNIDAEGIETLAVGGTVTSEFRSKDTGENYAVQIRALDADEYGPCAFRYSCDGETWHEKASDARRAA